MAVRFKKDGPRKHHFMAQWRRHRNLTQDQLAEGLGISKATLSRIENGKIQYGQDFLEAVAERLRCEPVDLLMRDPSKPDALWSVIDQVAPVDRPRVTELIRAYIRTGT